MDVYFVVKTLHIISSTILFGTGLGIAFFMLCSHFTDNLQEKFYAARLTVVADYIFTAPAVIVQPVTGLWMIGNGGYDPHALWLTLTYALYLLAGICWIPVVWIQIKLKGMTRHALISGEALPPEYRRLFTLWFLLGWPAFTGLIAIFFLMVFKPT